MRGILQLPAPRCSDADDSLKGTVRSTRHSLLACSTSPTRCFMNGPDPESSEPLPGTPEAARVVRAERLAAALRENLKRRKSRLRGRREGAADQNIADTGPVKAPQ